MLWVALGVALVSLATPLVSHTVQAKWFDFPRTLALMLLPLATVAAGWMVWEERTSWVLRIPLAAVWVLASPYLYLRGQSPHLKQWPWLELALLLALLIAAWLPLTAWAGPRRRAPA